MSFIKKYSELVIFLIVCLIVALGVHVFMNFSHQKAEALTPGQQYATFSPELDEDLTQKDVYELFDKVYPVVKHDLMVQYNIANVDLPTVETNEDKIAWLQSAFGKNLDPAEIRVLSDDNQRYTYEISLLNNEAVLLPLNDSDDAPLPHELLRNDGVLMNNITTV